MNNSTKSELLVETFFKGGETLMEKISQDYGTLDEEKLNVTALVVTGSICVNGQWTDFGMNVSEKDNQMVSTQFVHRATGSEHATAVGDMVNAYYSNAGQALSAYSHMTVSLPDSEEKKADGKNDETSFT